MVDRIIETTEVREVPRQEVRDVSPITTSTTVEPLYRSTQVVWFLFYVVETILLFRFLLQLMGANEAALFTQIIYAISYPLVAPFLYVVGSPSIGNNVIEWTTLLAMLVYWLLAWGIVRLIVMSKPVTRLEAHEKLERQDIDGIT